MLSVIAAIGPKYEIGFENSLIYHSSDDMAIFKKITTGKTVYMGYKTWASLPTRTLVNRKIVVIYSLSFGIPLDLQSEIMMAPRSLEAMDEKIFKRRLPFLAKSPKENIIAGGGRIYHLSKNYWQKMYLSKFRKPAGECDTWFPRYSTNGWLIRESKNFPDFTYIVFEKNKLM